MLFSHCGVDRSCNIGLHGGIRRRDRPPKEATDSTTVSKTNPHPDFGQAPHGAALQNTDDTVIRSDRSVIK
jgi:hypothetical protein